MLTMLVHELHAPAWSFKGIAQQENVRSNRNCKAHFLLLPPD
jgi:hypothetical protein